MLKKLLKHGLKAVMLFNIAAIAVAEEAPVYDVDSYPPQFDGQPDTGTPPPAPPTATPSSSAPTPRQPEVSTSLNPEQRLNRLEQQMTNLQHANAGTKLNDMQNDIRALRGQVESLTHQLQQVQTQQRAMYADLDKRISKAAPSSSSAPSPSAAADEDQPIVPKSSKASNKVKVKPNVAPTSHDEPEAVTTSIPPGSAPVAQTTGAEQEELQMYQNAYDLIKDGKFDQAIVVLHDMLKKYPSGQSAANAHYWLGELYGLQKKKDQSAAEFASVVKDYPNSPKVSDAQVKLGMIYAADLNWSEAKATFKKVMSRYPGTTSARLAAQQLKDIKAAGH